MIFSFDPVIARHSQILILGTLPGAESLRRQEYYADPKNQFWQILEIVFGRAAGKTYQSKLDLLYAHKIALWDVLHCANRDGSLDSKIRDEKANGFEEFLLLNSALHTIAFNGAKAENYFRRLVINKQAIPSGTLKLLRLPSTSPTPGKHVLSFDGKIIKWNQIKQI